MTFDTAIASLKQGEFVMIYDSDGRESEVDLMVAAEFCTPEHVARMRQHAAVSYTHLTLPTTPYV